MKKHFIYRCVRCHEELFTDEAVAESQEEELDSSKLRVRLASPSINRKQMVLMRDKTTFHRNAGITTAEVLHVCKRCSDRRFANCVLESNNIHDRWKIGTALIGMKQLESVSVGAPEYLSPTSNSFPVGSGVWVSPTKHSPSLTYRRLSENAHRLNTRVRKDEVRKRLEDSLYQKDVLKDMPLLSSAPVRQFSPRRKISGTKGSTALELDELDMEVEELNSSVGEEDHIQLSKEEESPQAAAMPVLDTEGETLQSVSAPVSKPEEPVEVRTFYHKKGNELEAPEISLPLLEAVSEIYVNTGIQVKKTENYSQELPRKMDSIPMREVDTKEENEEPDDDDIDEGEEDSGLFVGIEEIA